ncbi:hypothetical protein V2J09_021896 [Rumex salicifolius]
MKRNNQGCEIEAIGINYTIQAPGEKPNFLSLLNPNADHHPANSGRRRRVLTDVNFHAKPWEVLAIVGPSGAGKSSLLEILAGKIIPDSGAVYVNGAQSNPAHYRKISGYVTQKETLFPLLTVEETLLFSARLRLPAGDLRARVTAVLEELRLSHVAHTRVGSGSSSGGARGISGGERRRVSIGVDVIHEPEILLLDEPTSGLDSSSALQIIDMLNTMAVTKGRTIILSIHQPGFRIVKLFSSVLVLAGGAVVQSGTVEEISASLIAAGHSLPPGMNVIEFAIDSLETLTTAQNKQLATPPQEFHHRRRTLQQLFQQSKVVNEESTELTNPNPKFKPKSLSRCLEFDPANSRWKETLILTERFAKIVFRTKELFACRTLQMLISGFVLGSIFYNLSDNLEGAMERVGLFAFILTFLLSCTTEALPIFLQEREILMKETSSGSYRVSSYVIANSIVYLPFLLILAVLFACPVYWLVGLKRTFMAFSHFVLLIWLILYTANSVVVCFSALVPNFIVGNSVISGVMGSFFLFSGYFISRNEIPSYWVGMHYLSLFKYPYEGFLINEFSGEDRCLEQMFGLCAVSGKDVLREEGLGEDSRWRNGFEPLATNQLVGCVAANGASTISSFTLPSACFRIRILEPLKALTSSESLYDYVKNMGYLVQQLLCSEKHFVKLNFHLRPSLRNPCCNGIALTSRKFAVSCLQSDKRELPLGNARVEAHPESNLRVPAIVTALERMKITPEYFGADIMEVKDFQPATVEDITGVHSQAYVSGLEKAMEQASDGGIILIEGSGPTYATPSVRATLTGLSIITFQDSLIAAGAGLAVVDSVIAASKSSSDPPVGFALIRPPGHHAIPKGPMGFCVFGNIAIAARYAQRVHGLKRVFIIDFDVHHGNGTNDAFYEDPDIFFLSTHQDGSYPGTGKITEVGAGKGEGTTLNLPLPGGSGDIAMRTVFDQVIVPSAQRFKPDIILVSAGYDGHVLDPLASLQFTTATYYMLAESIKQLAKDLCGGRCVFFLEGGYNLDSLSNSVADSFRAFLGEPSLASQFDNPAILYEEPSARVKKAIERAKHLHSL